jgi:hypothetical protein
MAAQNASSQDLNQESLNCAYLRECKGLKSQRLETPSIAAMAHVPRLSLRCRRYVGHGAKSKPVVTILRRHQ